MRRGGVCLCSPPAPAGGAAEAPGLPEAARATYLHRVGEIEFLGRAAELLPGLVLRHRGPAAERESRRGPGPQAAPPGPPSTHLRHQRPVRRPSGPRWRRLLAPTPRPIGRPGPPSPNGKEGCYQEGRSPEREPLGARREKPGDGWRGATAPSSGLEERNCVVRPRVARDRGGAAGWEAQGTQAWRPTGPGPAVTPAA